MSALNSYQISFSIFSLSWSSVLTSVLVLKFTVPGREVHQRINQLIFKKILSVSRSEEIVQIGLAALTEQLL